MTITDLVEASLIHDKTGQSDFDLEVEIYLPNLYKQMNLKSKSEARRLIDQKGIKIDNKSIKEYSQILRSGMIIKIGKKSPMEINMPKLRLCSV